MPQCKFMRQFGSGGDQKGTVVCGFEAQRAVTLFKNRQFAIQDFAMDRKIAGLGKSPGGSIRQRLLLHYG